MFQLQAVEGVENEIERLLQEDALAEEVIYEIKEQFEGMDRFDSDDGATPAPDGGQSDMDIDGEMMDMEEDDEDEDEDDLLAELERKIEGGENSSDDEGEGDEPRSGALNKAIPGGIGATNLNSSKLGAADGMGGAIPGFAGGSGSHGMGTGSASSGTGSAALVAKQGDKGKSKAAQGDEEDDDEEDEEDDEEEDDDDDDSGSEEDDEDDENAQTEKLLKDEIKELNAKIKDNEEKLLSAPNDILKVRCRSIDVEPYRHVPSAKCY